MCLGDQPAAAGPQNGDYWQTLGYARFRNGNWQEAIAAIEQAAKRGSGGGGGLFMHAIANGKLGNTGNKTHTIRS